jgi:hypothetical protein
MKSKLLFTYVPFMATALRGLNAQNELRQENEVGKFQTDFLNHDFIRLN